MRAVYQRKQLHTFSLLSNLIGYLKRYCLQPACSHAFGFGGYKSHLHWVLPMSGFNNVLSIFAQSQGLVADTHKRCNELHPTKLQMREVVKQDWFNPHQEIQALINSCRISILSRLRGENPIFPEWGANPRQVDGVILKTLPSLDGEGQDGVIPSMEFVFQLTPHVEKGRVGLC